MTFGLQSLVVELLYAVTDRIDGDPTFFDAPLLLIFIDAVILAPLIETLIAQTIPINLTQRFTTNPLIIVGVATVIFAVLHFLQGPLYVLYVLPTSIIFALGYYLQTFERGSGYWPIVYAHAVHNGWVFLIVAAGRL